MWLLLPFGIGDLSTGPFRRQCQRWCHASMDKTTVYLPLSFRSAVKRAARHAEPNAALGLPASRGSRGMLGYGIGSNARCGRSDSDKTASP